MKKIFLLVVLILSLTVSAEAAKKVVAVMPLENVSGYSAKNVAEIMTEQIIVTVQNSGKFTVSERLQMDKILREQGFQNLTSDNPVEIGNLIGADYTLVGKVTMASTTDKSAGNIISAITGAAKNGGVDEGSAALAIFSGIFNNSNAISGDVEVNVRFVDNKTGTIVFAKNFSGNNTGANEAAALTGACKVAAENLLSELQTANHFTARVADIDGEKIYIDSGMNEGLQTGEVLNIVRETEPIIVNGNIVGMKSIYICAAKVIEVNADYSVCIADGGKYLVRKGDVLKRG